jgi:hypothetical protein
MEFEEFAKIPRLSRPVVITEKIDGTNAQIFIEHVPTQAEVEGLSYDEIRYGDKEILYNSDEWTIRAGSRNRWIMPGKSTDNSGFAHWVQEHAEELLALGPGRHYGEWWGQGIQRTYGLKEKRFSLFNTARWTSPWNKSFATGTQCIEVPVCHVVPMLGLGEFDTEFIQTVLHSLQDNGSFAAPGFMNPEGIVIYHTAGGYFFKKTILNDESPKSQVK